MIFKSIPFKEGNKVCYLDEKDVNLRETALETVYPLESTETSVKGMEIRIVKAIADAIFLGIIAYNIRVTLIIKKKTIWHDGIP